MFEYVHNNDGTSKTENICNKGCHKIFIASWWSLNKNYQKNEPGLENCPDIYQMSQYVRGRQVEA